MNKTEYFNKFQLKELFHLLHNAEKLIEIEFNEVKSKFKNEFIEEVYEVEGDNICDLTRIWNWFKPHKEWAILTEEKGENLREKIFEIVDFWKRN